MRGIDTGVYLPLPPPTRLFLCDLPSPTPISTLFSRLPLPFFTSSPIPHSYLYPFSRLPYDLSLPCIWSSSWISLSHLVKTKRKLVGISCVKDGKPMKNMNNKKVIKSNYTVIVTRCVFFKQLHFRVQPRSCLAFFQNGLPLLQIYV